MFISGHADIDVAIKTIKAGAVNFVTKPYRDQQLLDSINEALARDAAARSAAGTTSAFAARLRTLSATGTAGDGPGRGGTVEQGHRPRPEISHRTVELHRSHIFGKLGVGSVAELVRLVVESRAP